MLLFIIFSADPNEAHVATVTVSWRVQNLLWSVPRILNRSPPNFGRISNSIEIPSVGQAGIDVSLIWSNLANIRIGRYMAYQMSTWSK